MCTPDGYVFDSDNIIGYIKEHHKHPFTDMPLKTNDLIELHYHKDLDGKYIDPVTFKQFSVFLKIVANRKSGYVYSWSTIDEFNAKPDAWADLVTGDPFTKEDIIVLQDPDAPKDRASLNATSTRKNDDSKNAASTAASKATVAGPPTSRKDQQPYNAAGYSKGIAAASFTSTAMVPITQNESELIDTEEYMFSRIKSKGYVRVSTNMGDINIELFCDKAPRTCYNFIKLSQSGYYNGTKFHRSIKNFMIQGGDPTGSGHGGKSFWGSNFKDEIAKKLSHSERGILSMANHGPNTNGSQFFILYRAAKHLNGRHAIFGRVVGGLSVLDKIEAIPTDESDRPDQDIEIKDVSVFVDPYTDFSKRLERKLEHEKSSTALSSGKRKRTVEEEEEYDRETTTWFGTKIQSSSTAADATATSMSSSVTNSADTDAPTKESRGVGKYMKTPKFDTLKPSTISASRANAANNANNGSSTRKNKHALEYKFGDFRTWG
ncbi:cyclophilin peptidyl-prolyl cis-trans isomerase Cyp8 [Coemansia spiralis]|uniref:Cyclophilin peptidyl-prolyl cis-trans isomerase Cyp8 n=2 Tax=Coemansia TaxID=4863 RepID=A0A9W8G5C5_9FUNG|nr:cyclophilin peptidyl-prolyl cis-trans isomerase Cyp8 [Coemansia umbellata]KAJ2624810.1 cyclophilin peptidyl-prolyl cis-trans isomerase Cyp8 [Coemansia sp. RSA 1358]KAJ2674561.1 cyclophilin peptidyl-prolyl cis-trans isomerase Cyp8 [Coemansia spiralis]